jgi:hypothetical protein
VKANDARRAAHAKTRACVVQMCATRCTFAVRPTVHATAGSATKGSRCEESMDRFSCFSLVAAAVVIIVLAAAGAMVSVP